MSSDFSRGMDVEPIRGQENRDGANYFLTRANDAWMRLARYCELYEKGGIKQLLAEIDANTEDGAVHPNAVLLCAVRLAASLSAISGAPAHHIAVSFARQPNTALELHDNDRARLVIPR